MTESTFYGMWVVGLEAQIISDISMFPVQCYGYFWTPLHNQNVQEWNGIISLNFGSEFGGKPNAVDTHCLTELSPS
jgi:hypothetical protein